MSKADISPTLIRSRRAVLAGVACAMAAHPIAAAGAALAAPTDDPVFAAIAHYHRCAAATNDGYEAWALASDGQGPVPPELGAAVKAEQEAEILLASSVPASVAGVAALLELAASDRDCAWLTMEDADGSELSFEVCVMSNCADALAKLSAGKAVTS